MYVTRENQRESRTEENNKQPQNNIPIPPPFFSTIKKCYVHTLFLSERFPRTSHLLKFSPARSKMKHILFFTANVSNTSTVFHRGFRRILIMKLLLCFSAPIYRSLLAGAWIADLLWKCITLPCATVNDLYLLLFGGPVLHISLAINLVAITDLTL